MTMRGTKQMAAWVGAGLTLCLAVGVALALLTGLPGCSNHEPAAHGQGGATSLPAGEAGGVGQLVRVRVVRPTREHLIRPSSPLPAHVDPYEKTDLHARIAGYLDALGQVPGTDGKPRPVDLGDRVARGQILARLAVPEMEQERLQKAALVDQAQAEVGQAEAALAAAEAMVDAAKARSEETRSQLARYEAELAYRKSEYERYAALVRERAVRRELEDEKLNQLRAAEAGQQTAKAALTTALANLKVEQAKHALSRSDVRGANARLKVAQANDVHATIMLGYAVIKAPYDGIITRRLVDTGALIQSAAMGRSEPLFTLARVDRLRLVADVPEAEASQVKLGQAATFQASGSRGQPWTGKVVRFADALDSGTRTMRTEVELDGPTAGLRLGTFGSLTIQLANVPDALMIPTAALLTGSGKPAVYVVENGKIARREVEVGYNEASRVQVAHGLRPDEQVVADGKTTVREGQSVEIAP